MNRKIVKRIIELVVEAHELARSIGIGNLLQPGLAKEMIVADLLGHDVIPSKRDADACDPNDPAIKYEYLSCKEGGSGQLDRMFKEPADKRAESLARITRNKMVYLAVFYKANQIKVKVIYELPPAVVVAETVRQLDRSRNAISHVGFSEELGGEEWKGRVPRQSGERRKLVAVNVIIGRWSSRFSVCDPRLHTGWQPVLRWAVMPAPPAMKSPVLDRCGCGTAGRTGRGRRPWSAGFPTPSRT